MTPSELWQDRLNQTPQLEPYLKPLAKKWAKGLVLPQRMTLGPEPYDPALRTALSRIFGEIHCSKGKLIAEIPDPLRDKAVLQSLAERLCIPRSLPQEPSPNIPAILQRQRLLHPDLDPIHRWMSRSPEIARFLSSAPQQEVLLGQLIKAAVYLAENNRPVTLSKLGSLFFNDSKFLRNKNSIPCSLLGGMMMQLLEIQDDPENREIALQQFGVISNPATTLAALYGPLTLIRDGTPDTWIADRFARNEIITLNSTNLEQVEAVHLPKGFKTVITSENAAPFHELVSGHEQALILYTGGYPNAVVCRLLQLLSAAGTTCLHWGDSDPDGLLIASLVGRYIETSLYRCTLDEILRHTNDLIPLKSGSIKTGKSILDKNPGFKFRNELSFAVRTGQWLEQERWMPAF